MKARERVEAWLTTMLVLLGVPPAFGAGHVVAGRDVARLLPPAGARVEPYENAGYSLRFVEGGVEVGVDLSPLRSAAVFEAPRRAPQGRLAEIADAVTRGSIDRFDAVERILSWVSRNVRYVLDRQDSQDPVQVIDRGSAYCTGIARLTVALLREVGIEAREVPGYVYGSATEGAVSGFHRWVEVWYPDRGWVFSDPVATHQYVPATYLRLAQEALAEAPGSGALLAREDETEEIDLALTAPDRIRVRGNQSDRTSAALVVRLSGLGSGQAVLEASDGGRRAVRIERGEGRFLGLATGRYELRVESGGRLAARKSLVFRAPVLAEVRIQAGREATASGGMR